MNFTLAPFEKILTAITAFIDVLVPVIFAIALVVFLWGVFKYFIQGGASEEARDSGKQLVMWSIIGFTLMVTVWGIVNVLVTTLGFGSDTRPKIPTFGNTSYLAFPHAHVAHIDVEPFQHIL